MADNDIFAIKKVASNLKLAGKTACHLLAETQLPGY